MKKPEDDRTRKPATMPDQTRTGTDPNLGAVETVPEKKAAEPKTPSTTSPADWEEIKHPGMVPRTEDPYGTRPVSELTPPKTVSDKADLAAVRMMEKEKADRERIMTTATMDAAAARTATTSKEMTKAESDADRDRMKAGAAMTGAAMATGAAATTSKEMTPAEIEAERERTRNKAAVTGAALATGAAATRTEPAAGERTVRQGAAVDTPTTRITPERPVTGTVVPPGTVRATPLKPYGTMDERARMHAEDPSVHPDWETQPQINAPRDVGIPTAEGQADAARIRAGQRRSDVAEEPRLDRRGGDIEVPMASGARSSKTSTDDRSVTEKIKDTAVGAKETTKEKARDVKEDVDRKI